MFQFNKFIFIILVSFFMSVPTLADEIVEECKFSQVSLNSAEFHTLGNKRIYALDLIKESDWSIEPYGNHAAGALRYRSKNEVIAGGLYNFVSEIKAQEDNYPLNADERIKERHEFFSYPIRSASEVDLSVSTTISDIIIGKFTGYAVAYDITENWKQLRREFLPEIKNLV